MDEDKTELQKIIQYNPKLEINTFRDYNRMNFGDVRTKIRKVQRSLLEREMKNLAERKEAGVSEEELKIIRRKINKLEIIERGSISNSNFTLFNTDNGLFFNRPSGYEKGNNFWKLLNNISWWNLTGVTVTFFLFFNILDKTFFHPQKDGEEAMVLSFTLGVKRSDLFFVKILAFLTFLTTINVFVFLLPYGFYYFLVGSNISLVAFVLLSLYVTIIGPVLFFGLIFSPYIFINSWSGLVSSIASYLISFFPTIWSFIKTLDFKFHAWSYTVEKKFFDPAIFTIISVICGVVFLSLYYWKYQEEDLGN